MVLWVWNLGRTQCVAWTGPFSAQLVWRVLVSFAHMSSRLMEEARWLQVSAGPSSLWSQSLHMVLPTEELNCFHSCPGIQESIPWTRSRSCQCLRACPRSSNSILSTIFCWTVQSGSTQTQSTPNLSYWVQPRKLHIPTKWPLWNQVGSDLYWVIKVLDFSLCQKLIFL